MPAENDLGLYLKERRARLDPAAFGFTAERRRTPGLRREEVAQIAHVSATWYTWLEQGRGGAPSADVLDRLARAFALNAAEREHLYMLAQERPPKVHHEAEPQVSSQVQKVLDALGESPAIVKTPEWTVVAWNRAATVVLNDFSGLEEQDRNVLRHLFLNSDQGRLQDWEAVARLVVGTVRRDIHRAGVKPRTQALIDELLAGSEDFRRIWADQDVRAHGEGFKRLRHPKTGWLGLDFATFSVEGQPELSMVVFSPATDEDRAKIRALLGD